MDTFTLYPGETFLATPNHLKRHPRNMRRFYPQAALTEMAGSLAAYSNTHEEGNLETFQVIPVEGLDALQFRRDESGRVYLVSGLLYVVDGNLRLTSGTSVLKAQCPPFKCELITVTRAEELLTMTIANSLRYDPDPISEALHYKRLHDEEGLSNVEIAKLTGKSHKTISDRMVLLELDEPIQSLIAEGKLHSDPRVAKALLGIQDKRARVKLAERMADEGMSIKAIIAACQSVNAGLAAATRDRERALTPRPMVGYAERKAGHNVIEDKIAEPIAWETIREQAYLMCSYCEIKQRQLTHIQEPAWTQISHAAQQTCNNCNVRDLPGACQQCPGVDFLKRLILAIENGDKIAVPVLNGNGARVNA